jgi:hypothetical protein
LERNVCLMKLVRFIFLIIFIIFLAVFTSCQGSVAPTPTAQPALLPTAPFTTATPQPTLSPVTPSPAPTATVGPAISDGDATAILQEITGALSQVRGLEFLRPVQPNFMTRAEISSYLAADVDAEDQAELALIQELYRALGLLAQSAELYPLYLALLQEQVAGLFDLESEKLVVVTDAFPLHPSEKVTLAHELVHALQEQHFKARELLEDAKVSVDRELALVALLEGDANYAMSRYAIANLTPTEMVALMNDGSGSPVFDNAPGVIKKTFIFPYEAGAQFVSDLWQSDRSWRTVDQAYSRPPTSTEQVLHPAKYIADEGPRPVSLPALLPLLGDGWEMVWEDAFGEFMLRTYLESAVDSWTAATAAAGWGGDRFGLLRHASGQRVFVNLVEWDTPTEAQEFFAYYQRFTDADNSWASKDTGAKIVRWEAPGRSVLLALAESRTLLVLSPNAETASRIVSAFPQFQGSQVAGT